MSTHLNHGVMSSNTPEWSTPQDFFDELDAEFGFTLDVCSTHENAKCVHHFTVDDDGLTKSWAGEICWMNPPYGRVIGEWMAKAAYESEYCGATVVCLVPARTDTKWWHDYAMRAWPNDVRRVKGRLKFGDSNQGAPFPSAIVVFRAKLTERGLL